MKYFTGSVIGSQTPRLYLRAQHEIGSFGEQAIELAESAGLYLDEWQQTVLIDMLAYRDVWYFNDLLKRDMPTYAARETGCVVTRQNGKGPESQYADILTANRGWITFADIRSGDSVYGSDGAPTRVVAVSELYRNEDCYRVAFADGSSRVVGGGHLWSVFSRDARRSNAPRTTEYLSTRVGGVSPDSGRMEYNWRVRCDAVVQTPKADLPIDPYLLGYWLGDGSTAKANITVGAHDAAWTVARLERCGAVETSRGMSGGSALQWGFRTADKWSQLGFLAQLRLLGIFDTKAIPEMYLTASVEQRKALLAGLMDSDGFIASTNANVEFTTSIPQLADGFTRLARSLGIRVTRREGRTSLNGERKKDRFRFLWTPAFNPFEMPRKAEKWKAPISRRHELMSITSITRVPTVPVRCIQVEAEDGVYLTGRHFTPTHNSILEARELAGLFLLGERLIVHSAHEAPTSNESFERIAGLIENTPHLMTRVRNIARSHGSEGVYLKNGQRLLFKTRTGKAARGFTGDCVILDEAMAGLSASAVAALFPILTARPNPQLVYTASAGNKDSTQLASIRARAENPVDDDDRLSYAEWSVDACDEFCPKECRSHDRTRIEHPERMTPDELLRAETELVASYAKSNPGLGIRITIEAIEADRKTMPPAEFASEHLGVGDWPKGGEKWSVIPEDAWTARAVEVSQPNAPLVFAIDVAPNSASAAICTAGYNGESVIAESGEEIKLVHVEITSDPEEERYDHRSGTAWVKKRVLYLAERYAPSAIVLDSGGEAGGLVPGLQDGLNRLAEEKHIKVDLLTPNLREICQAASMFRNAVVPQEGDTPYIVHLNQPMLINAVAGATKREVGEVWKWSRRDAITDISPLVAATLANWALHLKDVTEDEEPEMWVFYR